MRTLTSAILIALASSLSAQVTVEVDTLRAAQLTAYNDILADQSAALSVAADTTLAQVQATVTADTLVDLSSIGGFTLLADTQDSQYIRVQLDGWPGTGLTGTVLRGAMRDAVDRKGILVPGSPDVVRLRRDRVLPFLRAVSSEL